MDTAAATGSLGSGQQNVGFAIPINRALAIAQQIAQGRSSPRIQIGSTGFMGVLVPAQRASHSSDPAVQRRLQAGNNQGFGIPPSNGRCILTDQNAGIPNKIAPVRTGALILGDLCNTPAAKAGITAGDVITAVGGQAVTTPNSLTMIMQNYRSGATATITWVDISGSKHTSSVVLSQAPPK
jgi:S1-C subfamily serine protease